MSDSVRPHRRQPTRLPRPWDSPGKNTGVGCHFLLQCMKVKSENEVAQSCLTLSNPMDCLKKTTPHLPVNLNGYFMMHFEYFQNICFHKKQRFSLKEWHICINNTPYSITSFFIKTESVRV